VPTGLSDLVQGLLEPDPDRRPASYDTVIGVLGNLSRKKTGRARGGERAARLAVPREVSGAASAGPASVDEAGAAVRAGEILRAARRRRFGAMVRSVFLIDLILAVVTGAVVAKVRPDWYVRRVRSVAPVICRWTGAGDDARSDGPGDTAAVAGRAMAPGASRTGDMALQPADFDFSGLRDALDRYVAACPESRRTVERQRVEYVAGFRAYLVRLMSAAPYRGSAGIRLRDGRAVAGAVDRVTAEGLRVRAAGEGDAAGDFGWDEIAFEQVVAMFEWYVNLRGRGGAPDRRQRQEQASDYVRLAVLCDWYGYPDAARRFGGLAAACDAETGRVAAALLAP
jgi:hypothetical protein